MTILPRRRQGLSVLLLVVAVLVLMLIWGFAQHFYTGSIRRRVAIAQEGRRALLRADTAVEEAVNDFLVEANEPPPGAEEYPPGSLGRALRELEPGGLLRFRHESQLDELPDGSSHPQATVVIVSAYLRADGGEDELEATDCDELRRKRRAFELKWSRVPG